MDIPDKITDIKDKFSDVKAAIELADEASGGLLGTLGMVAGVAAFVAAAMLYANDNLNKQQDILEDRAYDGKEHDLESNAEAIADTEKRIAELQAQADSGWGDYMSDQELESLKILLKTLQDERAELEKQASAAQEAAEASNAEAEANRDYVAELQNLKAVIDATNDSRAKASKQMDYRRALEEDAALMGITIEELRALVEGYSQVEEVSETTAEAMESTATATESTVSSAVGTIKEGIGSVVETATGAFEGGDMNILDKIFSAMGIDKSMDFEEVKNRFGLDAISDAFSSAGFNFDLSEVGITGMDEFKSMFADYGIDVGSYLDGGIGDGMTSSTGLGFLSDANEEIKEFSLKSMFDLWQMGSPSQVMADEVGIWIPAGVAEGMKQNADSVKPPIITMLQNMIDTFGESNDAFLICGQNVVAGVIDGINANMLSAYQAGQNLAVTVENGFNEKLQINSPSKVFAQLAKYIPMGVAEGVSDGESSAIQSVVILGDALIDAIMNSMAMVSTVASDDFEFSPRITPVVDLSDVNSAAGYMNGAFGGSYNMSAQMSGAISRRMADMERLAANIGNSQTVNNGDTYTFNIYGAEGQDPDEIADAVMLKMQNRSVRRAAAFG